LQAHKLTILLVSWQVQHYSL